MKHLPNYITLSRIVLSIVMLPIPAFSMPYFVIYSCSGVSDVLDGALARKFNLASEEGARLDSIADILFYGITAFKIMPKLRAVLTPLVWYIIAVVLFLRIISYSVAMIKYRRFASLHTYLNKLTGFLIFSVPYIISEWFALPVCIVIAVVAVLAVLEELAIHISTNQYCSDRKTLFVKRCENGVK